MRHLFNLLQALAVSCLALCTFFLTPQRAWAQEPTPYLGPITTPGVAIFAAPTGTAQNLAALASITDTTLGRSGFTLLISGSVRVCIGGADVNTTQTAGGKCFPLCGDATVCLKTPFHAKGDTRGFYLIAPSAGVLVTMLYGTGP